MLLFARVPLGQGGASSLIVFVERAAFIAALSLVLGIFVLVELLLRMGWALGFPLLFVAVSALVDGRRPLCVLCLWVRPILLCLR